MTILPLLATVLLQVEPRPEFGLQDPPAPANETAGARYRLWLANLGGSARSDSEAVEGTDVRLSTDLNLDETEVFHDLSAWIRIAEIGYIRAQWVFGTFDSSGTLDQALSFGGETFSAGSRVDSEIGVHLITALFELELWGADDFGIAAGIWLQAGGKIALLSTEIRSSVSSTDGSLTGFLPVIGARGAVSISDLFRAEIEINGLIFPGGSQQLRLVDAALEVGVTPWKGLYTGIGYHLINAYVKSDEGGEVEESDLLMQGIYFFAGWRF